MITKIVMSKFASYKNPTTLETDKKVNLIYGLNGTGKSTLSNFLYDPESNNYANCIADGASDAEVLVYNSKFVRDHFHEADKLNGIFTVSKENAQAEKDLAVAEEELMNSRESKEKVESEVSASNHAREASKASAEEKTWEIKAKYAGGDRVLEFCLEGLMGKKGRLFEHVASISKPSEKPTKTVEILKQEAEALAGDKAQKYVIIPELELDASSVETNQIFKTAIFGNQNSVVAGLIKRLENGDWVKEGVEYLDLLQESNDETCPFCQQKTITASVSEAIRGYFDESYENLVNELKRLKQKYTDSSQKISGFSSYDGNPFLAEKSGELSARHDLLIDLVRRNIDLIEAKIRNPSQDQSLEDSSALLEAVNEVIRSVNEKTAEHNKKIDNKKQEIQAIKTSFWQVMRWDYDQTISSFNKLNTEHVKSTQERNKRLDDLTSDISNIRVKIGEIQKSTVNVDTAIENINARLVGLGIESFSVVKYKENLYRIMRSEDQDGDFHSLSEGEKTVISFLYFLERCHGKGSATDSTSKKIVVIDDPISSLSHVYVFNVGHMIKTEIFNSTKFDQVFVLTHSLYFFYELTDTNHKRRKEWQKLFRLTKNASGSRIAEMVYEEVQNDYQAYWSIVKDSQQPSALIANCMRNIVEYFFGFVERRDFNNVFLKPSLQDNKHQSFYRFMNRESHSFGQNVFDYKEFDFSSFHEALKLVFEENGFPEHYATMMK